MARFENKVAFVTGSGSGIGRAAVDLLLADGAKVVGADLRPGDEAENYIPVVCDVTKEADVEALNATAVKEFGCVDAVHRAGALESHLSGSNAKARRGNLPGLDCFMRMMIRCFLCCRYHNDFRIRGGPVLATGSFLALEGSKPHRF